VSDETARTTDLKICGITRPADLRLVEQAEASHFGTIVDIPRSPRSLSVAQAAMLGAQTSVPQVCVMETADPSQVRAAVAHIRPVAVQLHGPLDLPALEQIRLAMPAQVQLWLALGLPAANLEASCDIAALLASVSQLAQAGVARIVLDTLSGGHTGGTGKTSDWNLAARVVAESPLPVMLAGGITAENVAGAVHTVRPAGIDASSGVEQLPGVKDPEKLTLLAKRFRHAVDGLQDS
jgi:phosphoribosylanthranilate isomerase